MKEIYHYKGSGLERLLSIAKPLPQSSLEAGRAGRDHPQTEPEIAAAEDHEDDCNGDPDDDPVYRGDRGEG